MYGVFRADSQCWIDPSVGVRFGLVSTDGSDPDVSKRLLHVMSNAFLVCAPQNVL